MGMICCVSYVCQADFPDAGKEGKQVRKEHVVRKTNELHLPNSIRLSSHKLIPHWFLLHISYLYNILSILFGFGVVSVFDKWYGNTLE